MKSIAAGLAGGGAALEGGAEGLGGGVEVMAGGGTTLDAGTDAETEVELAGAVDVGADVTALDVELAVIEGAA